MNVEAIEKVIVEMRVWAGSQTWPVESRVTNFAIQLEAALAEPEGEPLTEETPSGVGYWCDGKGGDWYPARLDQGRDSLWYALPTGEQKSIHGSPNWHRGLWRPYVPHPGPVLPQPIQGERPVPVVVTTPNGERWYASKVGQLILFGSGSMHVADMATLGYKWEVSEA